MANGGTWSCIPDSVGKGKGGLSGINDLDGDEEALIEYDQAEPTSLIPVAVGSVLLLGCFLECQRLIVFPGGTTDEAELLNFLPPPWLGNLRVQAYMSAFASKGLVYLIGLIVLSAAMVVLSRRSWSRNASRILVVSLGLIAWALSGDFRTWTASGFVLYAASLMWLTCQAPVAGVRLALVVVVACSGLNHWLHGSMGLFQALMTGAALAWLTPLPVWLPGGLLALLLVLEALVSPASPSMVPIALSVLCAASREKFVATPKALFGLLLVVAAGSLTLSHPQLTLDTLDLDLQADIFFRKGGENHHFQVFGKDARAHCREVVLEENGDVSESSRTPLVKPVMVDGKVLLNPIYFHRIPSVLVDPYVFRFYSEEVVRRWHPDSWSVQVQSKGKTIYSTP